MGVVRIDALEGMEKERDLQFGCFDWFWHMRCENDGDLKQERAKKKSWDGT